MQSIRPDPPKSSMDWLREQEKDLPSAARCTMASYVRTLLRRLILLYRPGICVWDRNLTNEKLSAIAEVWGPTVRRVNRSCLFYLDFHPSSDMYRATRSPFFLLGSSTGKTDG